MHHRGLEEIGGRYRVRIMRGRKRYYLGSWDTRKKAISIIKRADAAWAVGAVGVLETMELQARDIERQRRPVRNIRYGPRKRPLPKNTMDAQVWAKKWLKTLAKHPQIATDEETMIGWFSNAIMAGYDTAQKECNDTAQRE